jgi:hypothetical protein
VGVAQRELSDHEEAFVSAFVRADRRERERLKLRRGDVERDPLAITAALEA